MPSVVVVTVVEATKMMVAGGRVEGTGSGGGGDGGCGSGGGEGGHWKRGHMASAQALLCDRSHP